MTALADIAVAPVSGDRVSRAVAALWAGAAVVVLAAHAGAVLWALDRPQSLADAPAAPPAIMIELAAAPAAPQAEVEDIAPDLQDADRIDSTLPEADPLVEDASPPPLPDLAEQPPDLAPETVAEPQTDLPPPIQMPAVIPEVVQAPPPPRPERVAERREAPKEAPEPTKVQRREEQRAAKVTEAPPAEVPKAAQTTRGSSGGMSPATWQKRLMAHLERRKRYPASAERRREKGVAYVRFSFDDGGRILSAQLARSSGYPDLDAEAVALVKRASPIPAPPAGAARSVNAPIVFNVR